MHVALTVRKTDTNWVQYRQVAIFPTVKLLHHWVPEELLYTEAKETAAMDPHIYRCYDSASSVVFTSHHLAIFSRYIGNVNLYIIENFGLVGME